MRNIFIKITIVFFTLFFLTASVILAFFLLINNGMLTYLIERQINSKSDFNIEIGRIHFDIFSGLELNQISLQGPASEGGAALECNSLVLHYKFSELLKGRIRNMALSGAHIKLDADAVTSTVTSVSPGTKSPAVNTKNLLPINIYVENISISDAAIQYRYDVNKIFLLSGFNILVQDFQPTGQPEFAVNGRISFLDNTGSASPITLGEVALNGNYNILEDEVIIHNTSHLSIKNVGRSTITGNARSITSGPEASIIINSKNIILENISPLLKKLDLMEIPYLVLEGNLDMSLLVQGNAKKLNLKSNNIVSNLDLTTGETVFKAERLELPIEATFSPSNLKDEIYAEGECILSQGSLKYGENQIRGLNVPLNFIIDYPNQITLSSDVITGDVPLGNTSYPIIDLISDLKIDVNLKQQENTHLRASINTAFSGPVLIDGAFDIRKQIVNKRNTKNPKYKLRYSLKKI